MSRPEVVSNVYNLPQAADSWAVAAIPIHTFMMLWVEGFGAGPTVTDDGAMPQWWLRPHEAAGSARRLFYARAGGMSARTKLASINLAF